MKVGDLVKYNNDYTTDSLVGVILEILTDSNWAHAPYRVRWSDHVDSQRDWYHVEELTLL